jgi:hypothetical protein
LIPIEGFENYLIGEDGRVINSKKDNILTPSLNENGYLYITLWKENRQYPRTVHRLVALAYVPNPDSKPIVNHKDANRANPHKGNLEWVTQSKNIKHAYMLGTMSQKRRLSPEQLTEALMYFLNGETLTALSNRYSYALSPMSITMRNQAVRLNMVKQFTAELIRQKRGRNIQANALKKTQVVQLDAYLTPIATYESQTAAAKALGKTTSGPISNVLNGIQNTAYGFKWKFA